MSPEPWAKLMRIYVDETDRWHGQALFAAIVEALKTGGLAGAIVLKGIEGYGSRSMVHAARNVDLAFDLPVVIEVVETEEHIQAFLPTLEKMMDGGLVTLENVQIFPRPQAGGETAFSLHPS